MRPQRGEGAATANKNHEGPKCRSTFSDTHGRTVDETYRFSGHHLSEYDRTKATAHYDVAEPLIAAGLPLVIVQPGLIYGPGDKSVTGDVHRRYPQRKLPAIPTGVAYRWAHVDDVAHGHLLPMVRGRPGESDIIAGPRTRWSKRSRSPGR